MPIKGPLTRSDVSLTLLDSGRLSLLLRQRHAWQNSGPLVVLHYYDRQHPRAQCVAGPSSDDHAFGTAGTPSLSATGQLAVQEVSEGKWLAVASFHQIQIRITLRIQLQEDGFVVQIGEDDVVEGMPGLYRVMGIELLPDFGAARTGEEGYLTLPNWMGIQTFFNKTYPREVRQTIYSSNDQWEHCCGMPVFGITRAQGTMCGLISKGDFDAQLVCHVHWEQHQLNCVHPTLVYRWEQQDDLIAGPREVCYRFAPPDYEGGEGYVLCGRTYREFLQAQRGLLTWDEKAQTRPAAVDYRDRFFLKIFMAYKDPQADGKGTYHATCTFEEAREILEDCQRRGMKKLTAILVGWGQDGHDGMPPTRFPVDDRLGGEEGMKRLIEWCRQRDIMLGVHDSYGGAYSCSPEFNVHDLVRHRTGEYWESIIWSGGQSHIICPRIFFEKHVKRDMPAIRKLGIYGHHHIDAVGSFMTCYSKEHPLQGRAEYAGYVRRMFEFAIQQIGSVSTEMPFGPYFDVVDGFFHSYSEPSPWHLASSVGQHFCDRVVPLLTIALHGSCRCGESIKGGPAKWLRHIAMGMLPQYEVCRRPSPSFGIPSYDKSAELLAEAYQVFYAQDRGLPRIAGCDIVAHRQPAPGVTETTYSDGSQLRVNATDDPSEDLPAMSYRLSSPGRAPVVRVVVPSAKASAMPGARLATEATVAARN